MRCRLLWRVCRGGRVVCVNVTAYVAIAAQQHDAHHRNWQFPPDDCDSRNRCCCNAQRARHRSVSAAERYYSGVPRISQIDSCDGARREARGAANPATFKPSSLHSERPCRLCRISERKRAVHSDNVAWLRADSHARVTMPPAPASSTRPLRASHEKGAAAKQRASQRVFCGHHR